MRSIKKDGTLEDYNEQKIIDACNKAAKRAMVSLKDEDYQTICNAVWDKLVENDLEDTEIYEMHNIVESVLEEYYPLVAKMYKEYRNYKKDFVHMMDKVYKKSQTIRYIGDKSNANTDSALVATKRSLIYNELSSELYKKFFLTVDEKQAMKDGFNYALEKSVTNLQNAVKKDTINQKIDDVKKLINNAIEYLEDTNGYDDNEDDKISFAKDYLYQSIKVIEDSDKVKIVTLSEGEYQTLLSLIPKDVFK